MSTEQLIGEPLEDSKAEDDVIAEFADEDGSGLSIEVVDDRMAADRQEEGSGYNHESAVRNESKSVQKRINKLKYDFHEERRSKESSERLRDEAVNYAKQVSTENENLRKLVNQGERVLIDQVRARTETDVGAAKTMVRQALEDGDSSAIVDAQEALAKAAYESHKANDYEPVSEVPERPRAAPPARRAPAPPRPDAKAVDWSSKNTWFGSDKEMTAFAYAVHETAVGQEGLNPTSEAYYARIDEKMKERFPDKFEQETQSIDGNTDTVSVSTLRKGGNPSRPTTVVAPARRNNGSVPTKIQLTRTQVALAKRLGVTPEDYARQVLALEKANNG